MLSNQINRFGLVFSEWDTLEDAVSRAPNSGGVYVFRRSGGNTTFGRVQGESDIAYIGSSGDLKVRLSQHARHSPLNRIERFSELYPLQVAFATTPVSRPISIEETFYEAMLLNDYWGGPSRVPSCKSFCGNEALDRDTGFRKVGRTPSSNIAFINTVML